MPTPASNVHTHQLLSVFEDGDLGSFNALRDLEVRTLVRPASSSNPRRDDRTRAPGNWSVWANYGWFRGGRLVYRYLTPSGPTLTQSITGMVLPQTSFGELKPNLSQAESLLQNVRLKALSSGTEAHKQLSAAARQANDTLKMVGKASTNLAHGIDNLMQGTKGLAKRLGKMGSWKSIPNAYLEYLYGWAPLGDDLANAFDQLNNMRIEGFGYSMILKARRTLTDSCRRPALLAYPALGFHSGGFISGSRVSRAIATYRFDLPDWFIDQTPTISPFSTAHELTRLSFVADWFIPIGDWVGAIEAAQWSPYFVEGSETVAVREHYDSAGYDSWDVYPWEWYIEGFTPPSGVWDTFVMRRTKIEEFPYAFTRPPALNPFPGVKQAAQGLSLLTQTLQRWR